MGQPDCWLCIWKWQTLLFLSKARINILDDDTECVNSKWVNQIVDSVFGNDKLCCFCPRPESTFWTMTQNASTQNLKFPILLFHINKVGARINQMGHHFNKMGARINKMGHSESTKCGAPTIWAHPPQKQSVGHFSRMRFSCRSSSSLAIFRARARFR